MSIDPATYESPVERQSFGPPAPLAEEPSRQPEESFIRDLERAVFGDDGFTVGDLIDVVNPLQHIPVVSTLYRSLADDAIAAGPRLAGGGLFGGLWGLAGAAFNVALEATTGKDVGDHVLAMISDEDGLIRIDTGAPPRALAMAAMEPDARIALISGATPDVPSAPLPPTYAGTPAEREGAAAEAGAAATTSAAPPPAPTPPPMLDMASMDPDQRVAALLATPVGSAAGPAPTAVAAAEPSAADIPTFSPAQWQVLNEALRAYAEKSAPRVVPAAFHHESYR